MTETNATEIVLDTSEKYFTEILQPEVESYFANASSFRSAFNVARSLFHFHEWLYVDRLLDLESLYGRKFSSKGDFWGEVERAHQSHAFIRDFANASKHVRLTLKPSTSMTHIANTSLIVLKSNDTAIDPTVFGGSLKMKEGDTDVSFDYCVEHLFQYWEALRAKLP
jgi:hypothetical protein